MTSKWKIGLAASAVGMMLAVPQGWSEEPTAPPLPPATDQASQDTAPPPMQPHRPPMERAFRGGGPGEHGRWWNNPELAQKIGLSADQQKQMDDLFQQSRLKLIDRHADVEKEETKLEPLISADSPDEGQVLAQIDRVAQARAELEKANARMLLGVRHLLTADQWKKLKEMHGRGGRHEDMRPGEGGHADRGPAPSGPSDPME